MEPAADMINAYVNLINLPGDHMILEGCETCLLERGWWVEKQKSRMFDFLTDEGMTFVNAEVVCVNLRSIMKG